MTITPVIVNPAAGRGRGARLLPQVERQLHAAGVPFELHCTAAPWQAADLAEAVYRAGCRTVVAVGGDGTTNEVVNGLLRAAPATDHPDAIPTLGVVPIGSGNDFTYPFGLPDSVAAACQRIARGQTRTIDVGRVRANDVAPRFFVNGVGVGFDAAALIESRKIRRLRGAAMYLVALLRTVAVYYAAPRVRVTYDDQTFESESLLLSVMNGRRLGGAFCMTPQAALDDGLFDVLLTRRLSRLGILGIIPDIMRGTHLRRAGIVQLVRASHVVIEIDGALPAHLDGEVYSLGAHHYEMSVFPRRLRVIC